MLSIPTSVAISRYSAALRRTILSIFLFCPWAVDELSAQTEIFGAALVGGFNAAQIDGDQSAGYNKIGFTAGVVGITNLSEMLELNIELLYSQRGSRNEFLSADTDNFVISLDYFEIPVLLKIKDWEYTDEQGTYRKVQFHAGLSYSRLIRSTVGDGLSMIVTNEFKDNDISWAVGGGFQISRKLGVALRYTRSFGDIIELENRPFQSYFLTFRAEYRL